MYLGGIVFLWGFIGGTWNLLQTEQNILSDNHLQRADAQKSMRAAVEQSN